MCVDDNFQTAKNLLQIRNYGPPSEWPKKGRVYCIREVIVSQSAREHGGRVGFHLVGITNPIHPLWGVEMGFSAIRFRPVSEVGHPAVETVKHYDLPIHFDMDSQKIVVASQSQKSQ